MATARDVADWLTSEIRNFYEVSQKHAVSEIEARFGSDFTYINRNGNRAISEEVLREFSALTGDSVIWLSSRRMWRRREAHDEPGRQQP